MSPIEIGSVEPSLSSPESPFMKRLNKVGLMTSPCYTPQVDEKYLLKLFENFILHPVLIFFYGLNCPEISFTIQNNIRTVVDRGCPAFLQGFLQ